MRKQINFLILSFLLVVNNLVSAQATPPNPGAGSGGIEGQGTVPIDMYVVFLTTIAIIFIIYFSKRNTKKVA